MAKYQNDTMLDQALSWIKTNVDTVHVCSTQPTTYAEANSTYSLGSAAYTISASIGSRSGGGRELSLSTASSISISSTGAVGHIALTGSISSTQTLVYITTTSAKSVSSGDKVNMPSWKIGLADAT